MHRLDTFYNFAKYQILAINLNSVANTTGIILVPIMCLLSVKGCVVVFTRVQLLLLLLLPQLQLLEILLNLLLQELLLLHLILQNLLYILMLWLWQLQLQQ